MRDYCITHVGDSRIYINTDKKLYRLTKDHSFVQTLVDAGQLTDAEMETHPRKNELTKALGIGMEVDVEVLLSQLEQNLEISFYYVLMNMFN